MTQHMLCSREYEVYPEWIQPCNMKNRDFFWRRRYKVQETLYIRQWHLRPLQSRHLGTSHTSPNHHQLLCHIFLNLINGLKSFPFQKWFWFWEKPEATGRKIRTVGELSHLEDLMFHQNTLQEMWCMNRHIVKMKLPVTSYPCESSKYFPQRNVRA